VSKTVEVRYRFKVTQVVAGSSEMSEEAYKELRAKFEKRGFSTDEDLCDEMMFELRARIEHGYPDGVEIDQFEQVGEAE
jgi:hypothetical protein